MDTLYYPASDFGPMMKGMVIGGLGILHVFLAQFAIGGGILLTYFEYLSSVGRFSEARSFCRSYFSTLVLISFVLGAVTGVGMWLTSIQVSPRTIGLMIDVFYWFWAIEWTFFLLEVVAGYTYYRYADKLPARRRLILISLYSIAGWFSLFWINGILSWQLTPGQWVNSANVWQGFFNPSFFPQLLFRTAASCSIAAIVATLVVNYMGQDVAQSLKQRILRHCMKFTSSMLIMPFVGLWFLAVIPDDSRGWLMGGSPAMMLFLLITVASSTLIGLYSIVSVFYSSFYIDTATALLLVCLAFGATAGGEFVREGIRKPYTVRNTLYANSIKPDEILHLRKVGSVENDPYPVRYPEKYPNELIRHGRKVFRYQCATCHTMAGANALVHLTSTWMDDQLRMNIAQLQKTKAFMPPFAGTAWDLEALVQYIRWQTHELEPGHTHFVETTTVSKEVLKMNKRWIDEARPSSFGSK